MVEQAITITITNNNETKSNNNERKYGLQLKHCLFVMCTQITIDGCVRYFHLLLFSSFFWAGQCFIHRFFLVRIAKYARIIMEIFCDDFACVQKYWCSITDMLVYHMYRHRQICKQTEKNTHKSENTPTKIAMDRE